MADSRFNEERVSRDLPINKRPFINMNNGHHKKFLEKDLPFKKRLQVRSFDTTDNVFDDRKLMEKDSPRRSKRVRFSNRKYEDEYDMPKIQQPFARQYPSSQQVQHVNKTNVTLKHPPFMSNGHQDQNKMNKDKKKIHVQKPITRPPVVNNAVTDELKEFITHQMNCTDLKLVIQKELYTSDLMKSQNRLSMPINQVETQDFLTEKEKRDLENGKEFEVGLLGPTLKVYNKPMVLKMWHLKSTNNYVLKTNWSDFVEANKKELKEKRKIQVWSYRKDQKLCLALACVERHNPADIAVASQTIHQSTNSSSQMQIFFTCKPWLRMS